jgi:hypothetical protein
MLRRIIIFAALVLLSLPVFAQSAQPVTDPLFVPGKYVPISEFKACKASELLKFNVREDVIDYIEKSKRSYGIIIQSEGAIYEFFANSVSGRGTGIITLAYTSNISGKAVAATDAWRNDLPVVTHWKNDKSGGGKVFGATDGILTRSYNPETRVISITDNLTNYATTTSNDYYYNPNYNLFNDDPDKPNEKVPGYERYVSESYSATSIDNEMFMYFATNIMYYSKTNDAPGFPIVTKNSYFNPVANIPAYQIFNGCTIPSNSAKGHASLVTVILPPFWKPSNTTKYPILFTSHYGLNKVVYSEVSTCFHFARIMAKTLAESGNQKSAIALIWNAGGKWGTYSANDSFYDMGRYLFQLAADRCNADQNNIIATGISRGCITALNLASYPYPGSKPFTIKYIFGASGPATIADLLHKTNFWTYPQLFGVSTIITGLRHAWLDIPRDKLGESMSKILLGTDVYADAAKKCVNNSDHIKALASSKTDSDKTKFYFINGSHDPYRPFNLMYDYVTAARAAGALIQHDIFYRGGHGAASDTDHIRQTQELMTNAVRFILGLSRDNIDFSNTNNYYRKSAADPTKWEKISTMHHQPFVFEAPIGIFHNQEAEFTLKGEPFAQYKVELVYGTKEVNDNGGALDYIFDNEEVKAEINGTLNKDGNAKEVFLINNPSNWPVTNPYDKPEVGKEIKSYAYRVYYRLPGGDIWIPVDKPTKAGAFSAASHTGYHDTWDKFNISGFFVWTSSEVFNYYNGVSLSGLFNVTDLVANGLCSE